MTPDPLPICHLPDGTVATGAPPPVALLPGSFNPLHRGHRELAAAAARRLGSAVHFELSAANVDKPDLPADEAERRVRQFLGFAPVWLTRAATFERKADLFPGAAFVLGHDTAARLIDPRYYAGDPGRRDAALRKLLGCGCRVLVGGRVGGDGLFRAWDGSGLADEFRQLFEVIPEHEFRADISSTELRASP